MRYVSVCSGIEAATVAWHSLGWAPVAFAEIDAFPSAVLRHHYPSVPNIGDFTEMKGNEYGAVDLLVGGTPCQDFSVAGLRAGMDGKRGQLTVEFARLAGRMRPRWLVWENVPGVLSIEGGRAFGTFLGILGQLGYGFAYRILDAQHFGVPQRRRRVFVVGHLGDWCRAAAVLFERQSLSGHPAPRREAGQGLTYDAAPCLAASGRGFERTVDSRGQDCVVAGVCPTLNAGANSTGGSRQPGMSVDTADSLIVTHALRADGFDASEDGTGRGTPLVPVGVTIHGTDGTVSVASFTELAGALRARCPGGVENSSTTAVLAFSSKDYGADCANLSPTLRAMAHAGSHANAGGQVAVAISANQRGELRERDAHGSLSASKSGKQFDGVLAPCLTGNYGKQPDNSDTSAGPMLIPSTMAVRRLTPRECERLQGFPDDYTLIPHRGKPAADGPRYKALGNSMAVPVMRWIGERIAMVERTRA